MAASEIYYRIVDFLRGRRRNYQLVFGSPAGLEVLKDLARFCRVYDTTISSAGHTEMLEGRRQVFLRITQHLNLSSEELAVLYRAHIPSQGDTDQ